MNDRVLCLLTAIFSAASALAQPPEELVHKPVSAVYKIYGGDLGDETQPTERDKKVMFSVTGQAAKDLFSRIGPDVRDSCAAGPPVRVRQKDDGNLLCIRWKDGSYKCNFGFDLATGKSIGGIVC